MRFWIVRHACAGRKGDGRWLDDDRPLDPAGAAQASALASLLEGRGVGALAASTRRRCIETLEPLSTRIGIDIDVWESLCPDDGAEILGRLLRSPRDGQVVCTHGEAMQPLIGQLGARGVNLAEAADRDRLLLKGAAWELDDAEGIGWSLRVLAPIEVPRCPIHPPAGAGARS